MTNTVIALDNVCKSFKDQQALNNFTLHIRDGEFISLLGPSGCGKTTVLRLIGGFESQDSGDLSIDELPMTGVPPENRPVNTVFQNYALFPHMTVFDNVAFGLRMSGKPEKEIRQTVLTALKQVHLTDKGNRKPAMLSGGQQQRVAIARALVNKPRVLLLDEPMSALDHRLRKEMQKELKGLQQELGITFVLVTHDQDEAFTMSDRVVVMNHGVIEQIGSPREIYEEPVNLYVARFVGEINVLDAVILERETNGYSAQLETSIVSLQTQAEFRKGDKVHILLRPEDIQIEPAETSEASPHRLTGTVVQSYYRGATYDLALEMDNGQHLVVTEFFDEDAETVVYDQGARVEVKWIHGWEVVLPHEQ